MNVVCYEQVGFEREPNDCTFGLRAGMNVGRREYLQLSNCKKNLDTDMVLPFLLS